MEQTATLDAGTAEAQSTATDSIEQTEGHDAPAQVEKSPGKSVNKAQELKKILKREQEDPDVKFSDAELDILDEHYAGKLKAPKTKAATPDADESEAKDPEENPVTDAEDEEESEETESESEEEAEAPDPDAENLMKEVGAKNLKDALAKVKELRNQLGGKGAQAVARLTKERDDLVKSASNLWGDVAKGVPEALSFVEKTFGFKAVPLGQGQQQQTQQQQAQVNQDPNSPFIDPDKFIDPDSAQLVNSAFQRMKQEMDELKSVANEFKTEKERNRQETALRQGELAVIDEMVQIAQRMEPLKGIPNLREAINAFYKGTPDPRLDVFNELFEIAKDKTTDLDGAWTIKRGREAERLIAEAESRGRKAAYGHKPNPSLSGSQGGKGETTYQPLSEQQIEAMAEDHTLMPPDWFDKDENPIQSKIPKKAWGLFGFK